MPYFLTVSKPNSLFHQASAWFGSPTRRWTWPTTVLSGAPFQPAVAVALALGDDYYTGLRINLQDRRDQLLAGLRDAGFTAFVPEGTYFITADITPLGGRDGMEFCRTLPHDKGVVAVPTQVFYDDVEAGRRLVRFTFCKREEVLAEAVSRLRA